MDRTNEARFQGDSIYIIDWKSDGLKDVSQKLKIAGCVAYSQVPLELKKYDRYFMRVCNPEGLCLDFFQPDSRKDGQSQCDGVVMPCDIQEKEAILLLELKEPKAMPRTPDEANKKIWKLLQKAEGQIRATVEALELEEGKYKLYRLLSLPNVLKEFKSLLILDGFVARCYGRYGFILYVGREATFASRSEIRFLVT